MFISVTLRAVGVNLLWTLSEKYVCHTRFFFLSKIVLYFSSFFIVKPLKLCLFELLFQFL